MSKVMLKYAFIFDPAETWETRSVFEGSLADYLKTRGLQAEIVNDSVEKVRDEMKLLIISKSPEPVEPPVKIPPIINNRDANGKFQKVK